VLATALALAEPATAATLTVTPIQNGQAIGVEGELMEGDDQRFEQVIPPNVPIIVDFNSPGGNLLAGLAIGAIIHDSAAGSSYAADIGGSCE
jgi:hypothetical protein